MTHSFHLCDNLNRVRSIRHEPLCDNAAHFAIEGGNATVPRFNHGKQVMLIGDEEACRLSRVESLEALVLVTIDERPCVVKRTDHIKCPTLKVANDTSTRVTVIRPCS